MSQDSTFSGNTAQFARDAEVASSPRRLRIDSTPAHTLQTSTLPFAPWFAVSLLDAQGHVIVTDDETLVTAVAANASTTLIGQNVLTLRRGRAVFGNVSAGVDLALIGASNPEGRAYALRFTASAKLHDQSVRQLAVQESRLRLRNCSAGEEYDAERQCNICESSRAPVAAGLCLTLLLLSCRRSGHVHRCAEPAALLAVPAWSFLVQIEGHLVFAVSEGSWLLVALSFVTACFAHPGVCHECRGPEQLPSLRYRRLLLACCSAAQFFAADAGTYANMTGLSSCLACPPGKFSKPEAHNCTACPSGTIAPMGSAQCSGCSAGMACCVRFRQRLSIRTVLAGKFASRDHTFCDRCPDGQGGNNGGQCAVCPPGTASQDSLCVACEPGKYNGQSEQTLCRLCQPGRAQAAARATQW